MNAVLLGPHPDSDNFSIVNYFNFYRANLGSSLPGWDIDGKWPGVRAASSMPVAHRNMYKTRWENFVRWPLQLARVDADLVHVVDQGLAWYGRFAKSRRTVVTVHDLISHMSWDGSLPYGAISSRRKIHLAECARQIKLADHVVSVSQSTANNLRTVLGVPASKVTVIPNVVEAEFSPLSADERAMARLRWFPDAEHVVIHVGKASSYKNRIGALRTFDLLHRRRPGARMFLVHGIPNQEEAAFLRESPSRRAFHFLAPLSRAHLREFYGAADVLIFPSLYEGFGWPPLEAMACGCPVVCSTRGSLKEVVDGAALTLDDPHDHKGFAELLMNVLQDAGTARDLKSRGFERVKHFTPARLLTCMADVYKSIQ